MSRCAAAWRSWAAPGQADGSCRCFCQRLVRLGSLASTRLGCTTFSRQAGTHRPALFHRGRLTSAATDINSSTPPSRFPKRSTSRTLVRVRRDCSERHHGEGATRRGRAGTAWRGPPAQAPAALVSGGEISLLTRNPGSHPLSRRRARAVRSPYLVGGLRGHDPANERSECPHCVRNPRRRAWLDDSAMREPYGGRWSPPTPSPSWMPGTTGARSTRRCLTSTDSQTAS